MLLFIHNINSEIDIGRTNMKHAYLQLVHRFICVADVGSIQGAARRLNLSQPALTQSIKHIEDIFGCRLFDRTKKGVLLTAMGERLAMRSRRMLEELELAGSEIGDLLAGRSSTMRISAGTAWGYCYLPAMIQQLQERFPDLEVDLDIALTSQALPSLCAGRIDVFLGADVPDFREEGFARQRLSNISIAAACGLSSPLVGRERIHLEDFAQAPVIIYQDDENLNRRVVHRIEKAIGRPLEIAVRTKSLLASLELVRTGRYTVFIAEPFLEKFSGSDIRLLPLNEPLYQFPTAIFYRKTLMHAPPFRALLDLLEAHRPGH